MSFEVPGSELPVRPPGSEDAPADVPADGRGSTCVQGHFLLHDGQTRSIPLFEDFLAGYAQEAPLPPDHRDLIRLSAITSGLRQLWQWLGPGRDDSPASDRARRRAAQLRNLLAASPHARSQPSERESTTSRYPAMRGSSENDGTV